MAGATRSIVINAPMDKVFDAITAYEAYPQWISECKTGATSNRSGNQVDVNYVIEIVKTVKYSLRMTETRPSRLSWTFVSGEIMKDNQGSWALSDAGGGKTQATYTVDMKLPIFVPKSVVSMLVDAGLPKMLEALKKRVESAAS